MSDMIQHLTDREFERVVTDAEQPILVDFWAEWCGPCKALAPALEELAQSLAGKVTIAKVNVDHNPQTAQQLGIRSIPTLYLFRNGQPIARHVGTASVAELQQFIDKSL